jgi:hypothetical protein
MFAASIEEPRRHSGLSIWFAAAGALVLGILIGFASGYRAGQYAPGDRTSAAAATEHGSSTLAPTSGAAAGQPFSESAVPEPVRVDPEPIVPSPDVQAGPRRGPERGAEPAPQVAAPAGQVPPKADMPAKRQVPAKADQPVVGRVPSPTGAAGGGPAIPATGPGSLQVISRPAGAQVILDGKAVGRTPLSIPDVAAGEHGIRLELPGFNRWSTTVDVKAGSPSRVAASLEQ